MSILFGEIDFQNQLLLMFMFQNGLLATFIPEIIMVIAYLVCLIAPGDKQVATKVSEASVTTNISSCESNAYSRYSVSVHYFTLFESILESTIEPTLYFSYQITFFKYDHKWLLTKGLSFKQFSRPPPNFIS